MSRPVISPTFCATSSPEHTLEVMQKRLQMAEDETKKLVNQLSDYGFSKEKYEKKDGRGSRIEPISPFKPIVSGSAQVEILQRNYEQMVSRVCRAESTIQSLKLAMCSLQAERDLCGLKKDKDIDIPKDTYDREIKTLESELSRCKQELNDTQTARMGADASVQRLTVSLEKTSIFFNEAKIKLEEARGIKQKLTKKVNELKEELSREQQLRNSLEQSHTSLLHRVNNMEKIVETERNDVQMLAQECQGLKTEVVVTKEEYNKECKLRVQLQMLMTQLQEDSTNTDAELATLAAERKNLNADITRLKQENKELRQQFEALRSTHENLKVTHEKVFIEHKKVSEELRGATVDNRVLLSQQREAIHRERHSMNVRIAEQDRALDMAKQALVIEVEEERARLMAVEKERTSLKAEISRLNNVLLEERNNMNSAKSEMELKVMELEASLGEVAKEKDTAVKEKAQILEEIGQTVNGFSQERNRIVQQLKNAQVEIERLQQKKAVLERESQQQLDRLVELENKQSSQHQIEDAMKEIIESKNRLAYEKGSLQSKVDHLNKELNNMTALKMELDQLRRGNTSLQNQYNKASSELQACRIELQSLQGRLREFEMNAPRKDNDLRAVMESREEALREVEKLVQHTEAMERSYRQKVGSLQKSFNEAKENNNRLSCTMEGLMNSHVELQAALESMQTELGRRDAELKAALHDKNSAFETVRHLEDDLESLQNKLVGLENNEVRELRPLRKAVKNAKEEHQDLAQQLERALRTNKKLQNTAEKLQMELGRKDVELENLLKDRDCGIKESNLETVELQERMEELETQIKDTKNKHRNQVAKLKRDLEDTISLNAKLKDTCHKLEHHVQELEQQLDKNKTKMKSLKYQLDQTRREKQLEEDQEEGAKTKVQNFKIELNEMEKVKTEYVRKNMEQSKTIDEFVSKIAVLQRELKILVDAQNEAISLCRQKEKELEKERARRKDIEQRLIRLQMREKELDSIRRETEQKLQEANDESQQISENLKQAHKWFKNKFDGLQVELTRSKKIQNALERENRERQKKIKEEKRNAEDQTEKAKEILRASRLTINRLAGDAAENLWETKGMKHALQAERDNNATTSQKLQRLQESTARHMEGLALELDTLRRSNR